MILSNRFKDVLITIVNLVLFAIGIYMFASRYGSSDFNGILTGIMFVFLSCLLGCLSFFRYKYLIFFFYIAFFTFLLSRPFISMCKGDEWVIYSSSATTKCLLMTFTSLVSIKIGSIIALFIIRSLKSEKGLKENKPYLSNDIRLRVVCKVMFIIFVFFSFVNGLIGLISNGGNSYASSYASESIGTFSIFGTLASFTIFPLCIYLSTLPKKKETFIMLLLYIVSTIPTFILGSRGDLVLSIIFSLAYYIFRAFYSKDEKWISGLEIALIIICVPICLFGLGAYNYIRDGETSTFNLFDGIVDFFYKQGVSFDISCRAYELEDTLSSYSDKNFLLGSLIDTAQHGTIAVLFFGATSLGGNTIYHALYSNSFSHLLSYYAEPNYLNGNGLGSSFILEAYYDGGIGMVIFISALLGFLFILFTHLLKKDNWWRVLTLLFLTSIYLIPRASFSSWFSFLVQPQLWLVVILCVLISKMLTTKKITITRIYGEGE